MNESHGTWNDDGQSTSPNLPEGKYMNMDGMQGSDSEAAPKAEVAGGTPDERPRPTAKPKRARSALQGRPAELADPQLWPESVCGQALANAIHDTLQRFLVLPDYASSAITLWVLHAHAHESAEFSPILLLTSPERRCGKTTTLGMISRLVPRPLPAANASPASIFRIVDRSRPTLLIDEAETFLEGHEELRGILNSGHSRDAAFVLRTAGEDFETRQFATWCPKAIAKIGAIHGTLEDRSIVIEMRRKLPDESCPRVRRKDREDMSRLTQMAWTWARANSGTLVDADPDIPDSLHDRAADNWRHLLAIAERIGGEWPEIARSTAVALSGATDEAGGSELVRLLTDLRDLFGLGPIS